MVALFIICLVFFTNIKNVYAVCSGSAGANIVSWDFEPVHNYLGVLVGCNCANNGSSYFTGACSMYSDTCAASLGGGVYAAYCNNGTNGNSCTRVTTLYTSGCVTCSPSSGSNGSCGSASGGTYETYPTSGLCNSGSASWIDSTGTDGFFDWSCSGSAGSCGGSSGSSVNCSAYKDNAPVLASLVLKTYDGDTVAAETGDRNQICQSIFKQDTVNPNGVQFVVTGSDVQGTVDIGNIQVRLRNASNTYTFAAVASTDGVATIPVDLSASGVSNGTYNIEVLINDITSGVSAAWIDTNRDFKYWDCKVSVSGGLYEGTSDIVCPNFNSTLVNGVNFTSLTFVSSTDGLSSNMTVNSDSTYTSGSDYLIWGTSDYQAIFNNKIAVSNISLRLVDMGTGTTNCSPLDFDLTANVVDPYANTPQLKADFSGISSQDAWFQTVDGGVLSKSIITNYVPITCSLSTTGSCVDATAINGLVAAPTLNSIEGVPYSSPNDWYIKLSLTNKINYFEKYKTMTGVGATLIEGNLSDSDVINNTSGLLMVNGNVNITQNKTTPISMIVAKGDITIDESVTRVDGILVGNNINIGGSGVSQLVINGSLYGTNLVNITRSYANKVSNNTSPAVLINYKPDFMFNMPSSMNKSITNWKWGN